MTTTDPRIETGELLTIEAACPSKESKQSKKNSGVFRRLKNKYSGSQRSPSLSVVRKPHLNYQGVLIREVPAPISPSSKKQRAEDMAKRISKKMKKIEKNELVIPIPSSGDEEVFETPEVIPIIEPSSPEKTIVIPPGDSSAKSLHEKLRMSNITTNVSDMDVIVNMGEGYLHQEAPKSSQGIPVVLPIKTVSSAFVSLPLYMIPTTSTTESPTFKKIINQAFTSIFSSQSTDPPKPMEESENEEGDFGGSFEALQFDDDDEDFPYHMLMSMKQFKTLNKKMNSIILTQADIGGR
ncbi:unnamed protein product [Lactuca saligna]|uniref:Uncharacterized protein n=1 Tax=Lactuca saligna TaxID=75948 RepID=A0AA36E6V0_LACSI|nr:unnamed protein product [Lactuca saligna]